MSALKFSNSVAYAYGYRSSYFYGYGYLTCYQLNREAQ